MKKVVILFILISSFIYSSNNKVLFSLNDTNYTTNIFPNDFNNLSKKDKKNFIGEFIYYKLLLDELKDEQKKYKKNIEEALKKNISKFNRVGADYNSSFGFLSKYKTIFNMTLKNKLLEKYKPEDINKKVEEFYNKHKKEYQYPDRIEVSHIVVKKSEKDKILNNLIKDKNTSIKKFAKMAKENSLDKTSRYMGGYIGYITKNTTGKKFFKDMWDSNITNNIYPKTLDTKKYSHILYIFKKEKSKQISLEEDRDNIVSFILKEDKKSWIDKNIEDVKKRVKVKLY